MKEIIDETDVTKIINFCCVNDNVKKLRQAPDWGEVFAKTFYEQVNNKITKCLKILFYKGKYYFIKENI